MPVLRAGPAVADIDPVGGRIRSLIVDGMELLVTRASHPIDHGLFPMVPFAGRLRNGRFAFAGSAHQLPLTMPPHAIHGTVLTAGWATEAQGDSSWCGRVPLGPPWPLGGWAVHDIRLHADRLHLRLEIGNDGSAMPATCGWHPWWRRRLDRGGSGSDLELDLDLTGARMYERDDDGVPTGELVAPGPPPWDDCFTAVPRPPVLRWPGVLELTYATALDHWVVFSQPPEAICVEPQSGPPDAFNLGFGFAVVEPGRPLVGEVTIHWSFL